LSWFSSDQQTHSGRFLKVAVVDGNTGVAVTRVSFVGLGRVARALAVAFTDASFAVTASYDTNPSANQLWSERLSLPVSGDLMSVVDDTDFLFITTSDNAISDVAHRLAALDQIGVLRAVFHTSGALGSDVLEPIRQRGIEVASIHPVMSFLGRERDVANLRRCTFCVEAASETAVDAAMKLCNRLGVQSVRIPQEAKSAHHLACVLVSNFSVLLLAEASEVYRSVGVPLSTAEKMLGALAEVSLENSQLTGVEEAMTGPFVRGDSETVLLHLSWLARNAPHLVPMYRILAMRLTGLARRAGRISAAQEKAILEALRAGDETTSKGQQ